MSMKFMRKSIVAMMDLVILIFIQVQANDLLSTHLHHSSLSNLHRHPLNLNLNIELQEFYGCLSNVERCEEDGNNLKKNPILRANVLFLILTACKNISHFRTTKYFRKLKESHKIAMKYMENITIGRVSLISEIVYY